MKKLIPFLLNIAAFGQVAVVKYPSIGPDMQVVVQRAMALTTTVPGSCTGNGFLLDTDGTLGANLYICNGSTYDLYAGTGGSGGSGLTYYGAFASLPPANTVTDGIAVVTDCATVACAAGSGSIALVLWDSGSAWVAAKALLPANPTGCTDQVVTDLDQAGVPSCTTVGTAMASIASQAEAEAGSASNRFMTPERTAQAIAALGAGATVNPAAIKSGMACPSTAASTTAYSCVTANTSTLAVNQVFIFIPDETNTGNVTISINGSSAKPYLHKDGDQFAAGDIIDNDQLWVIYDGTNFRPLGEVLSTNPGKITFNCGTAPSTPASDKVVLSCTSDVFAFINDAGTRSVPVVPDTGSSNNFLTAISAGGVISKAQPSVSNISGLGTGVATALAANVSGSGAICLASGSACSGGSGLDPFDYGQQIFIENFQSRPNATNAPGDSIRWTCLPISGGSLTWSTQSSIITGGVLLNAGTSSSAGIQCFMLYDSSHVITNFGWQNLSSATSSHLAFMLRTPDAHATGSSYSIGLYDSDQFANFVDIAYDQGTHSAWVVRRRAASGSVTTECTASDDPEASPYYVFDWTQSGSSTVTLHMYAATSSFVSTTDLLSGCTTTLPSSTLGYTPMAQVQNQSSNANRTLLLAGFRGEIVH